MNLEHFMRDALDNIMTCSLQVHDSSISWNLEVGTQAQRLFESTSFRS